MRKSFTRFFGFLLLSVMMFFSYGLYAQGEAQSTIELKAPTVGTVCYNATNSYPVTITTRDFVGLRSFKLFLRFDQTEFGLSTTPSVRVTGVNPALTANGGILTSTVTSVNATTGQIEIDWSLPSDTYSSTIGDNAYANLFTLNFQVVGFPNNSGDNSFDTNFAWTTDTKFYYGYNYTGSYNTNTTLTDGGSMTVNVSYPELGTTSVGTTNCNGSNVTLALTNPAFAVSGMTYAFNAQLPNMASWTFGTASSTSVTAPSTVTIRVKDAGGCLSHQFTVDVTAPDPLQMAAPTVTNAHCNGELGNIVFNYAGGVAPYVFYVVPSAQMANVLLAVNSQSDASALAAYAHNTANVQMPAGTYYIAMTAGGCNQNLFAASGSNWVRGSAWHGSLVTVTEPTAITVAAGAVTPASITCNGTATGAIDVKQAVTSSTYERWPLTGGLNRVQAYYDLTGNLPLNTTPNIPSYAWHATSGNSWWGIYYAANGYYDRTVTTTTTYISGGAGGTYSATINGTNWLATNTNTTATFTSLVAGTYTVTIKDANGCTASVPTTVIQPDAIQFTPDFIDASCASSTTGSIWIASVTPAESGDYQYEYVVAPAGSATPTTGWKDVTGTTSATSQFTNLAANYYSVWVRVKDGGCDPVAYSNPNQTGNVLPIQAPGALAFTTNADNALDVKCNGNAFTLTVTPTGGVAPYLYSFNGSTYTNTVTTFTPATTTTTTNVVVGVRDALGCTVTRTVAIDVAPAMTAYTTGQVLFPTCKGNNDGRATIAVSGGSLDLAKYGITGYGYSTDGGVNYDPGNVISIKEGNTIVTVIDGNNCKTTVNVYGGDLPANTFTVTATSIIACNGEKDGTLSGSITSWNYQNGFNNQPDHHPVWYWATTEAGVFNGGSVLARYNSSFNPTTFIAGDYWVGVRDEYGCTAGPVKVTIKQRDPLAFTTTTVNANCFDSYSGQIIVSTTGGNNVRPQYYHANSMYAISVPGAPFTNIASYTGYTATQTALGSQTIQVQKGTYYIVLRDACGTVTSTAIEVGGFDAITASVVSTTESCDTNNATITAKAAGGQPEGVKMPDGTLVAGTGTGNYTYTLTSGTWSKTITAAFGENAVFANLDGGDAGTSKTYHLVVKDTKNCTPYEKDIVVKNPGKPVITNVDVTHFTCETSHDGKIKVTVDNNKGIKPYYLTVNDEISWIPFGNAVAGTTNTNVTTYIATEPGVYYLKVRDSGGTEGCIGNTVSVTVLAPLPLTLTGVDTDVTCAGNGTVALTAGGGYTYAGQDYNYKLDGGSYQGSNSFTNLAAGTHTATVKVVAGSVTTETTDPTETVEITYTNPVYNCTATYSFVTKGLEPYAYKAKAKPLCKEGEATGELQVKVSAGVATSDGEYYVQLTTTAQPSLQAGTTYWKKTTNKSVTFTGLPHAIYSVWISNGYTRTSAANPDDLCLLPTGAAETVTTDEDGFGGPYYRVESWEILYPTVALTTSATLTQNVTCHGGNDGAYTVSAAGGWGAPYYYASGDSYVETGHIYTPIDSDWKEQTASGTYTFTGKASTYVVWAKDALGCIVGGEGTEAPFVYTPVNAWRVKVSEPRAIAFNQPTSTEVKCYGGYTGSITVTKPEGRPFSDNGGPYTVKVTGTDALGREVNIAFTSTNTTSITVPNVPASYTSSPNGACVQNPNTFTVTVTDGKGCTSTPSTVAVRQNKELGVTLEFVNGGLCPGDVSGVVVATAVGGTEGVTNGVGCHQNWAVNADGLYRFRLYKDGSVYQAWTLGEAANGNYPKFVVEVGHYWKVEVIDGNGCTAMSEELHLVNPAPISIKFTERTCFTDTHAKTEIKIDEGTATRTFTVTYKGNTETTARAATQKSNGIFEANDLIFANQITEQNFYTFYVTDNVGCTASVTRSFVATQIKLEATVAGVGGSATVTVSGGIGTSELPYAYALGTAATWEEAIPQPGVVSGGSFAVTNGLVDGLNTIKVFDGHGCSVITTYDADITAPTATYSPNGTTTPTTDNHPQLVITFSEDVAVGAGNITIKKKSDDTPAIAAIPASAITISGKTATVTYAGGLDKDTEYYVVIDAGVVKDLAGNAFAGVTATNTWTFKTGPVFATPVVPDPVNALKFKVYPNPFVNEVTIDNVDQLSKVVISNIAGQVVKVVVNPSNPVDGLNGLNSGVYFITLYKDNKVVSTVKLLKR